MNVDRMVIAFAGFMVLLSVALAYFHSRWWLWLTVFVGVNLLQSAFSGFCPAAKLFRALGARPGPAFGDTGRPLTTADVPPHDRD